MRPRRLDEIVGQQHLLKPGSPLQVLSGEDRGPAGPSSIILWGPPGTGKTTLAHVIARGVSRKFVELSAITAGVKDVRKVMDEALTDRDLHGRTTVLFLDEIHRFTKAQQDALLPGVENQWVVLVAATTENPSFSVISPLLSRSLLLTLQPLERADIGALLDRAVADPRGLNGEVELSAEAREHLLDLCGGDARKALTSLEAAAGVAFSEQPDDHDAVEGAEGDEGIDGDDGGDRARPVPVPVITREHAEEALDRAAVRYDKNGDQHYDVVSAFIKSIRGSDVDAAMHYLARMIEAGEDPRFIARRLIISASEDIGTADPTALQTAVRPPTPCSSSACPRGGSRWPRPWRTWRPPRSPTPPTPRSTRPSPTSARAGPGPSRSTCGTPTTPGRAGSATAGATSTPTTSPTAWPPSSTRPTSSWAPTTTGPPSTAASARSPTASRSCGASSGAGDRRAQRPNRCRTTDAAVRSSMSRSVTTPARRAPTTPGTLWSPATTHSRRGIRRSSIGVGPLARRL